MHWQCSEQKPLLTFGNSSMAPGLNQVCMTHAILG